jgi:hypothetical protein
MSATENIYVVSSEKESEVKKVLTKFIGKEDGNYTWDKGEHFDDKDYLQGRVELLEEVLFKVALGVAELSIAPESEVKSNGAQ